MPSGRLESEVCINLLRRARGGGGDKWVSVSGCDGSELGKVYCAAGGDVVSFVEQLSGEFKLVWCFRGTNGPRWSGPLPPGYTVDELRWHRKKRPPAGAAPSDNLTPSDGSMRAFRTEYSRRFRPFRCGPPSSDDEAASAPEDAPSDDELPLARRRRPRGRRDPQVGQTLGSVDSLLPISTEHREKYIPMALSERGTAGKPTLIRRPTSLSQLTHPNEGEVARSETAERFARDILTVAASGPCKRRTQLRLDGPLLTSSETKSSFVPQDGGARPPLAKRATTLRLEGDLILLPEYRRSYVSPTPKPDLPPIEPPPKPVEPPPKPKTPPKPIEPPAMEVKKVEEDVKVVGRRKDLIPIDRDPEYRSSFVDFTRERTQAATPSRPPSRQRKYSTATVSRAGAHRGGTGVQVVWDQNKHYF